MEKKYSVKNLVFFFYIVIPIFFYGIPLIVSLFIGPLRMYFFGAHSLDSSFFFWTTLGHILLGLAVYRLLGETRFQIKMNTNNRKVNNFFIVLFFFLMLFIPLGYFGIIFQTIFLILISRTRPPKSIFILLMVGAILNLIINYDRFPVIVVGVLYFLPFLGKENYKKLALYSLLALILLIYILQPIRGGNFPFSGSYYNTFYFVKHLFPIYIGAYLSFSYNFEVIQLIAESLPLAKSIFSLESTGEIIARNELDPIAFEKGIRFGTNSAIYFKNILGFIVIISLVILLRLIIRKLKDPYIYNSVILLLVLEGPYFIRHSFGQAIIQLIICIATAGLFSLMVRIRWKMYSNKVISRSK